MNFALGCAFNVNELFLNFNLKKIKLTTKQLKELGFFSKRALINKIFTEHVKQVVDDIIDNSAMFELPTGSKRRTIMKMNKIEGEDFKKARKRGKFKDIDILASNFSGYQIGFNMYYADGRPCRERVVYVDGKRKKKITSNVNNGKQYY